MSHSNKCNRFSETINDSGTICCVPVRKREFMGMCDVHLKYYYHSRAGSRSCTGWELFVIGMTPALIGNNYIYSF
jgi:hypothetical protein